MSEVLSLDEELNKDKYNKFFDDEKVKGKIVFLCYGGSYAYGTNVESSDIDIRGCVLNSKNDILLQRDFEQRIFCNNDTDICVYSVNKLIKLLTNCNPNVIEILGLPSDKYAFMSDIGKMLIDSRKLFLSKKAVQSFGGYATQQLRRLSNKAVRTMPLDEKQQHILNSMQNAQYAFEDNLIRKRGELVLRLDDAEIEYENGQTKEIFADVHLNNIPVRDFEAIMNEISSVRRMYNKNSKRNEYAASHDKLGKHMMHLIRLYLMCFDILKAGEIVTYREKERQELLDIRNGKYLDENDQPTEEFFGIVDHYESKLKKLAQNTKLPDEPDYNAIDNLRKEINMYIIRESI